MKSRAIGDRTVSEIGLGGMPMSIEGRPDRERSIAAIHASLEAGVTLIDTADAYHLHADEVGHNEELIAEALRSWGGDTSAVLVATKGGHLRPGDGSWTLDGRPEHLKEAARASAKRLGVAFLPWSPLGGISSASELGGQHAAFEEVADAHGVSPQQVCLAWMLAL